MLPIIYMAGALAARSPAVIATVSRALGVNNSASAIVAYARSNPVRFATVAATAVAAGDAAWSFVTENPEMEDAVRKLAGGISHAADSLSMTNVKDLENYRDELELIKQAILSMGSMDRLLALRKALALPDEYYALYRNLRSIKLA